ncbi:hypothetical protein [Pseudomonas sp. DY-1]|uniref:hypothetical protein n=1 Tax=Pseudomonas sp. DY-1 TaxID=1755504 RepID=UPI0013C48D26|nr:hypothetical protein [Pseudomonas sp. DY-1]
MSAGFSLDQVRDFTLDQAELFMSALADEQKSTQRTQLLLLRAARAKSEQYRKVLKSLS